jgi:hypothetical protein
MNVKAKTELTQACPFECCVYRVWNTTADTVAYAKPDKNAKMVGLLKAGTTVEAITGEVHSSHVGASSSGSRTRSTGTAMFCGSTPIWGRETSKCGGNAGRGSRLQPV